MHVTMKDLHRFQKVMMDQFWIMDEKFNQRLLDQEQRLRIDFHGALEQHGQDLKRDIRDEMDAKFGAMNRKMDAMEGRLIERIDNVRAGLVSEISDMLGDRIVPQIDELYDEDKKIKQYIGML